MTPTPIPNKLFSFSSLWEIGSDSDFIYTGIDRVASQRTMWARLLNLSENYIFQHLLVELDIHINVSIFMLNDLSTTT